MKLVVALLSVVVLCVPVLAYALGGVESPATESFSSTADYILGLTEVYGSLGLISLGLMSLWVARKRQKDLSV